MDFQNNRLRDKILFLDASKYRTGGLRALMALVKEMHEYEVHMAVQEKSPWIEEVSSWGVKVFCLDYEQLRGNPFRFFAYCYQLIINAITISRYMRKNEIRYLHANDFYILSLILIKWFSFGKIKTSVHVRLMPDSYLQPIYPLLRWLHQQFTDHIFAVSDVVRKKGGWNDELVHVMYDVWSEEERHPKYVVQEREKMIFLYPSNLIEGKGQDLAIKAFAMAEKKGVNACLVFVGETYSDTGNSYLQELIKMADKLGVRDKVRFEPFVTDIEGEMKMADVVMNLSVSESFSFVCYDALRFGIPLIATNSGGPGELIKNGYNGYLIQERKEEEVADKMYQLYVDIDRRRQFSNNSREEIKKRFEGYDPKKKFESVVWNY